MIDELDSQIKPKVNKEVVMSITKTCNKIYEPKLYDESVNNPIHN